MINDLLYRIEEHESDDIVYLNKGESETSVFGRHVPSEQKVYIHKHLSNEAKRRTLVHELTHAFVYAYGLEEVVMDEEGCCKFLSIYSKRINEIADRYMRGDEDAESIRD